MSPKLNLCSLQRELYGKQVTSLNIWAVKFVSVSCTDKTCQEGLPIGNLAVTLNFAGIWLDICLLCQHPHQLYLLPMKISTSPGGCENFIRSLEEKSLFVNCRRGRVNWMPITSMHISNEIFLSAKYKANMHLR